MQAVAQVGAGHRPDRACPGRSGRRPGAAPTRSTTSRANSSATDVEHDEPLGGDAALAGVAEAGLHRGVGGGGAGRRRRAPRTGRSRRARARSSSALAPAAAPTAAPARSLPVRVTAAIRGSAMMPRRHLGHDLPRPARRCGTARPVRPRRRRAARSASAQPVTFGECLSTAALPADQRGAGEAQHLPEREVPRHHREHDAERLVGQPRPGRGAGAPRGRPASRARARRRRRSSRRTCRSRRAPRPAACPSRR